MMHSCPWCGKDSEVELPAPEVIHVPMPAKTDHVEEVFTSQSHESPAPAPAPEPIPFPDAELAQATADLIVAASQATATE